MTGALRLGLGLQVNQTLRILIVSLSLVGEVLAQTDPVSLHTALSPTNSTRASLGGDLLVSCDHVPPLTLPFHPFPSGRDQLPAVLCPAHRSSTVGKADTHPSTYSHPLPCTSAVLAETQG